MGAVKGVAFEHDIKADVLVAMALVASVLTREFFAAGEVALIMQIGSLLEDYTSGKAREGIEKLIRLTPQTARILSDGAERIVPAEQVAVVASGTVNRYGTFTMRAGKVSGDSSLQRMICLAEEAEENKVPIVTLADKWAPGLVVVALLCAIAIWVFTGEFMRAVTALVVFCPCAFILATPVEILPLNRPMRC